MEGASVPIAADVEERKQLEQKVAELEQKLKDVEYEKNNIEYTLSRRQDEYMQVNEQFMSVKEELSKKAAESDELVAHLRKQESEMVTLRNTVKATFMNLTELLTLSGDDMQGKVDAIHAVEDYLFAKEGEEGEESDRSSESPLKVLTSSLMLSRQTALDLEARLASTSELSHAQESQIARLEEEVEALKQQCSIVEASSSQHVDHIQENEEESEVEKEKVVREKGKDDENEENGEDDEDDHEQPSTPLQSTETLNEEHTAALQQIDDLEEELEELHETNENLRRALRGAKDNMEASMKRQEELESQLNTLQNEFVELEAHHAEMVNQVVLTGNQRAADLEKKLEQSQQRSARLEEEMSGLRASWETSVNQYEQELAVLRSRKVAVEKQVSVSEQFLEDQTRLHRNELMKVQEALRLAEEEKKELRCQVLEREAELESVQASGEETGEQLQTLVTSLREQLRSMQTKLSQQQMSANLVKKREGEMEKQLQERLAAGIQEMKEKDREIIRQQQKNYEEELSRMREQITVLTHQLEEERKSGKKMRETVVQLNELFESQDRQIEILKSDVGE